VASRPVRASRAPDDHGQDGFSVIEVMVGLGIFAVLAIGFASTMATSLTAQVHSRLRTTANQLATQQVEQARALAYDDVGTVNGNPIGLLPATNDVVVGTTTYRVQTDVQLVADRVPTAFTTYADYKRLVVTVTRPGSTTSLARLRTLIAPPTQPSLTKTVVQAEVVDATSTAQGIAGVTVQLTGPSGPTSGITDDRGYVVFPALPPTSAGETYSISASGVPAPWKLFTADQLASAYSGPALATQTKVLRLLLSRPVPVQVQLRDANGATFAQPANVTVTSNQGTSSYTTSTGALGPIDLWSGVTYTVAASSVALPGDTTARFSIPATVVPQTSATTTSTLSLVSWPTRNLTVQVRGPGSTVLPDIAVRIAAGPQNVLLTGTTAANGNLVVPVPYGTGTYTVTVDAQGGWGAKSTTTSVGSGGASTTLTLAAAP
jgi:prepilin-type N-terminal cleavage/methylation domain-containing protein